MKLFISYSLGMLCFFMFITVKLKFCFNIMIFCNRTHTGFCFLSHPLPSVSLRGLAVLLPRGNTYGLPSSKFRIIVGTLGATYRPEKYLSIRLNACPVIQTMSHAFWPCISTWFRIGYLWSLERWFTFQFSISSFPWQIVTCRFSASPLCHPSFKQSRYQLCMLR
jgi:hypothetical protein